MKSFLFFLISCFVFCFCSAPSFSQVSVLKIDSTFDVPFFRSPRLLFPDWVSKGKSGKLVNTRTGKKIHPKDTLLLKVPARSQVVRYDNLPDSIVPDSISSLSSHALIRNDTLFLYYAFEPNPQSDEMEIAVSSTAVARIRERPVENSGALTPTVELKSLRLNKRYFKKQDELKAELQFSVEFELNDVSRGPYRQRVYYKGWLMCKVE